MTQFHSPYQFIPVKPSTDTTGYASQEQLSAETNTTVRHDYWHQDNISGRIKLTFSTVSPLVLGAEQSDATFDKPAEVSPYVHNVHKNTKIAIPANSLRGMIASIVETLSQSSFRVLATKEESAYTVRQDVKTPLKMMGVLYKEQDEFYLYKLPTPLKIEVYQPSYGKDKTTKFLNSADAKKVKTARTYHQKQGEIFYATQDKPYSVVDLSTEPANDKLSGVLYIRGKHFKTTINETFIPWDGTIDKNKGINVTQQVQALEKILRLYQAKKNPEKALPQGYQRNWQDPNSQLVMAGDLLYYKETEERITELSYSQIWRKPVTGNLHDALQSIAGENILPWQQKRDQLTPAEAMFGVVEEQRSDDKPARNLAARIQFTDATAENVTLLDAMTLKILDSPKPPSPSMYFHGEKSGQGYHFISKQNLNLEQHKPNGRKHYLPQPSASKKHWTTNTNSQPENGWQQYLNCKPIDIGVEFNFNIHFENLSKDELGLLYLALQPAKNEETFIHRLGLGKPLGLGQIEITSAELEQINRVEHYTVKGLKQARYQKTNKIAELATLTNNPLIDSDTLKMLQTLYHPANIKHPVCYPFSTKERQQAYNEKEGYQWFKHNKNQMLGPMSTDGKIPTLKS